FEAPQNTPHCMRITIDSLHLLAEYPLPAPSLANILTSFTFFPSLSPTLIPTPRSRPLQGLTIPRCASGTVLQYALPAPKPTRASAPAPASSGPAAASARKNDESGVVTGGPLGYGKAGSVAAPVLVEGYMGQQASGYQQQQQASGYQQQYERGGAVSSSLLYDYTEEGDGRIDFLTRFVSLTFYPPAAASSAFGGASGGGGTGSSGSPMTLGQGPAPSSVSQVDAVEHVEVAVDSGAATGAEPAGAGSGGAEPEGAEPGGAESGGAEPW
ncbi:unnamed protein product, partial [Closterium sp. NIES-54]